MTQSLYDLRKRFVWEMAQAIKHFEPFDDAEKVLEQIVKAKAREAKAAAPRVKRTETQMQRATHQPGTRGGTPIANQQDVPHGKRRCSKCGQVYPLEEFVKSPEHKDGRGYACKACERARARERWARKQAALRSNPENSSKYTAQNS